MPHKAVGGPGADRLQRHRAARIMGTFGALGQMCIFIPSAIANIVMRCIRQTEHDRPYCVGLGKGSCWSRDRGISISVCISAEKDPGSPFDGEIGEA